MTDLAPIILPDDAQPDDVFHVIADIANIIKLMPLEELARFSGGKPPWAHYEDVLEDPKSSRSGWITLCAAAHEMAIQVLDGYLPNPLESLAPSQDLGKEYLQRMTRPVELTPDDEKLLRGLIEGARGNS